ncbi:MAG: hydroxymyristoyl-ACP dehydratase [Clostridia bacterium]
MTNINCSANCVYQKDGKCSLEQIASQKVTLNNECAYFLERKEEEK